MQEQAPVPWAREQRAKRLRLCREHREVLLVGTIHGNHWDDEEFPIDELDAVLELWRPELVMLEQRPDAEAFDGPPEMLWLRQRCLERHVPTAGIDWWLPTGTPGTTTATRERHLVANVESALTRHRDAARAAVFLGSSHVEPVARLLSQDGWVAGGPAPMPTATTRLPVPAGWRALLTARSRAEQLEAEHAADSDARRRHHDNAAYLLALAARR